MLADDRARPVKRAPDVADRACRIVPGMVGRLNPEGADNQGGRIKMTGYGASATTVRPGLLRHPARGTGFLGLLGDPHNIALMRALATAGPLERAQLGERVHLLGGGLEQRLARLARTGIVIRTPAPRDRRRRLYMLACCGYGLLDIFEEATRALAHFSASRQLLLRAIFDPWDRTIMRSLVERPRSAGMLQASARSRWTGEGRSSPLLGAAGLKMRIDRLRQAGLLCEQAGTYMPGEEVWRLSRVAALSALWRWRWTPDRVPQAASDLPGLLMMLAPATRSTEPGRISVLLQSRPPAGSGPHRQVQACLIDGRMSISRSPTGGIAAQAWAQPDRWLRALLDHNFDGIAIIGDVVRAHVILHALADALAR